MTLKNTTLECWLAGQPNNSYNSEIFPRKRKSSSGSFRIQIIFISLRFVLFCSVHNLSWERPPQPRTPEKVLVLSIFSFVRSLFRVCKLHSLLNSYFSPSREKTAFSGFTIPSADRAEWRKMQVFPLRVLRPYSWLESNSVAAAALIHQSFLLWRL